MTKWEDHQNSSSYNYMRSAKELNINHSVVVQHLKQTGKVKKPNKWVPRELMANQKKILLKCYLLLLYTTTNLSQSACDVKWKVDFRSQQATTSLVVGLRRSSKALLQAKLAPKTGHGHCLVVCCLSDPPQLSESQQKHYIWEVRSANWWDALKTATPAAGIGPQKGSTPAVWYLGKSLFPHLYMGSEKHLLHKVMMRIKWDNACRWCM